MDESRRKFILILLQSAAAVATVGASPVSLLSSARRGASGKQAYDWNKYHWGYAIDLDKCIGCGRCVNACKMENDVPDYPFYFRTWVERYVEYEDGGLAVDSPDGGRNGFPEIKKKKDVEKSFFVPKLCNHCERSPCTQVCPVGASYMTNDGVVMVDRKQCVGCRYCVQACPYGSRYLHPTLKVADKCTFCYHRITKGLLPACVMNCPVEARIFGNLKDADSPIRRFIRENRVQVLKPHIGTHPKVVYKGIDKEVR